MKVELSKGARKAHQSFGLTPTNFNTFDDIKYTDYGYIVFLCCFIGRLCATEGTLPEWKQSGNNVILPKTLNQLCTVENKATILLSIFKRKGGDGSSTKIINENNIEYYLNLFVDLIQNDVPLIIYHRNEDSWVLFTDEKIVENDNGALFLILYSDLFEVSLALQEELRDHIVDKQDFTRLRLKYGKDKMHILTVENGKPFQGLYQILHFIVGNNSSL